MPHPELASEQAYVDNAYARLDKMRTTLEGSQDRMATEFAAVAMEAWLKRRRRTFQDAERGLCFGRLTLDGTLRPLYVGRRWVGARRRARGARRQLAGAGGAPVLHGHAK